MTPVPQLTMPTSRYVLDASDEDLRRLLRISEIMAEPARTALSRTGISAGWRALDCGCGPLGGLAVLAEMVGPDGQVVGVDVSDPTVQHARSVVSALGLTNVEVVLGDVHDLEPQRVGAPFDLVYTRCFLMHQADPAETLARIAGLLRPGGWVICQEPLRTPPPRSHPDLAALEQYWELMHDVAVAAGVSAHSVDDLADSAEDAGFEAAHAGGFFRILDPHLGFELHATTLVATRSRILELGIASSEKIAHILGCLDAARAGGHHWVSTPFHVDLVLRKAA